MADPGAGAWQPGAVVGEYRLVRPLGAGGMGSVDLARHEATGALRAIKSLPSSADPALALRFRREAEGLARVDGHPNVARVHSVGQALGRHYLVMDHLAGGDLEARLRLGTLPPLEAARLGADLARALAHVHARGVLHRDLKPANVLFDGPAPQGRPVLVDFGLARVHEARSLTATGEVLGTPAYMAPEQARGEAVDARTDVYGLGALLYRAVGGRAPAAGRTVIETLAAVIGGERPPLRALAPGTPPALERVIARALEKRPGARFPSASALAGALDDVARDLASGAPSRSRGGAVAAGLALLAVAAVVTTLANDQGVEPAAPRPTMAAPTPPAATTPPPASAQVPPTAQAPPTPEAPRRPARVEEVPEPPDRLPDRLGEIDLIDGLSSLALGQSILGEARSRKASGDDPGIVLAARHLARAARSGSSGPEPWRDLGRLFAAGEGGLQRSPAEAVRCFRQAVEQDDAPAMRELGEMLRSGWPGHPPDLREARDVYERLLENRAATWPELEPARFGLARIACLDSTIVTLARGLELYDGARTDAVAQLTRGRLRAALGEADAAARELQPTLDDLLWGGDAAVALIDAYRRVGRDDDARAAFAELERRAERDQGHSYALGLLLRDSGDLGRATTAFERAAHGQHPWARHNARIELYRLCARGLPLPVSLERARELLAEDGISPE